MKTTSRLVRQRQHFRRFRCDTDGELWVEGPNRRFDHCPFHPDAEMHEWKTASGMGRAMYYIEAIARSAGDLDRLVERFDGVMYVGTSQGEMALCLSLMRRWGIVPEPRAIPATPAGLFG